MPTKADRMLSYCVRIAEEFQTRLSRMQAFVKHNLSSGSANETILREFLSSHAPASYVVGQGFICDPLEENMVSRQCDVLVYEQDHFPLVYSDGSVKIVLPRAARMVVEVKTNFTRNDIWAAIENIESAKRLNEYLTGIIFAFKSPSLDAVIRNLEKYPSPVEVEHLPTAILLLDKDVIIHGWSWLRRRELEADPHSDPNALSVRVAKNKQKGLAVTCLLSLLFQSTETEMYEAQMINMLIEVFEEYTVRTKDVLIGGTDKDEATSLA